METVRSRQNAQVKALRRAVAGGGRAGEDAFLIDSWNLLGEAARHSLQVQQVFVREDSIARWHKFQRDNSLEIAHIAVLSRDVFDSAMATPAPQGVAAIVARPAHDMDRVFSLAAPLLVVLAGIQDPGNAGTVLRSAQAFGADAAFLLPGTADAFSTKALRASAGAPFSLPVFSVEPNACFDMLRANGTLLAATVPRDGTPPAQVSWQQGVALVFGAEGPGLDGETISRADLRVTIPMPGGSESLNVATAAGILLYEAAKARTPRA